MRAFLLVLGALCAATHAVTTHVSVLTATFNMNSRSPWSAALDQNCEPRGGAAQDEAAAVAAVAPAADPAVPVDADAVSVDDGSVDEEAGAEVPPGHEQSLSRPVSLRDLDVAVAPAAAAPVQDECHRRKLEAVRAFVRDMFPVEDVAVAGLLMLAVQEAPAPEDYAMIRDALEEHILAVREDVDALAAPLALPDELGAAAPFEGARRLVDVSHSPNRMGSAMARLGKAKTTTRFLLYSVDPNLRGHIAALAHYLFEGRTTYGKATFGAAVKLADAERPLLLMGTHLPAGFNIAFEASRYVPKRLREVHRALGTFADQLRGMPGVEWPPAVAPADPVAAYVNAMSSIVLIGDLNFRVLPSADDAATCERNGKPVCSAAGSDDSVAWIKQYTSVRVKQFPFGASPCRRCIEQTRRRLVADLHADAARTYCARDSLVNLRRLLEAGRLGDIPAEHHSLAERFHVLELAAQNGHCPLPTFSRVAGAAPCDPASLDSINTCFQGSNSAARSSATRLDGAPRRTIADSFLNGENIPAWTEAAVVIGNNPNAVRQLRAPLVLSDVVISDHVPLSLLARACVAADCGPVAAHPTPCDHIMGRVREPEAEAAAAAPIADPGAEPPLAQAPAAHADAPAVGHPAAPGVADAPAPALGSAHAPVAQRAVDASSHSSMLTAGQ